MKIIWSTDARRSYINVLDHLNKAWGKDIARAFRSKVNKTLKLITNTPNMYPLSKKLDIRKCVVSKQNLLLFRVSDNNIEIIDFIDTRSDHSY